MDITICQATEDQAEAVWQLMYALDFETKYMMYEPGERSKDIERVKDIINTAVHGDNLFLVAEDKGELIGYLLAQRGRCKRVYHSAYIVVGVRAAYQNYGIGSKLFAELDYWAKKNHITRLELTVMCQNEAAKHLYEKNGFTVEGIKKQSMIVDNEYVDEYYMSKLF
ncbi:MAG: GNAT family N-acetyltransferase [Lacrimispora sp.]|uniref:GNAT family N-acetyltransferase n=1 Tax=Lacrimispora sp. TaxID=2719234 RepID=UPI0039E7208F